MLKAPEISFGTPLYTNAPQGEGVFADSISGVSAEDCRAYLAACREAGFRPDGTHSFGDAEFTRFTDGDNALYLSYYPGIGEMRLIREEKSAYLHYADAAGPECTSAALTQIDLEDFGLSYVIRLRDGRYIVFDGGCPFEPDADSLMRSLETQAEGRPIRVAAWIMTHPHRDHYRNFPIFWKKYAASVTIEKFLYNFPDVRDTENIPRLLLKEEIPNIRLFEECVRESGAQVYKTHTGQIYRVGGVRMEILSSPDDTYFPPINDLNHLSLVIRMEIEGQIILWGGDAFFPVAKLAERFGSYLKSDILQVPHHGFVGGREQEYALINPRICLYASFDYDCFENFNIYMPHNRFLFFDLNVEDLFVGGSGDIVLPLPCEPRPNGRKLYLDQIKETQDGLGARSWCFMDVTADTCTFSVLNLTAYKIDVWADLFFENSADTVVSVKIAAPGRSVKKFTLTNPEEADPEAKYYHPHSLAKKGIPEGSTFAVRFRSRYPVVIRGDKAPDYFR